MIDLFLKIVNMSISASWLILAVFILRLVLKKAPKWVNVLLWGIVAVRLLCPFSIESTLSLIPSSETISPEIMMDRTPEISTGIHSVNSVINPIISDSFTSAPAASANPLQILIPMHSVLWIAGVALMLLYTAVSYRLLRKKVDTAVILRDNIFQSEHVSSPFVLGILKPRIYLPFHMDGQNLEHVVAHEQAHIHRKDHWWKPLGFLLLAIHWFNPLMWIAYVLLCRDIELACDERVIKELGSEQRAAYTQALVDCSVNRCMIAACPLAFGEVGVKERVKSVMNYKKPAFWIVIASIMICVVVALCFLTDPTASPEFPMWGDNVSDLDVDDIMERIRKIEGLGDGNAYMNSDNFSLTVTSDFDWADSQTVGYFFYKNQETYSAQLRILPEEERFFVTESSEWVEQDSIFLLHHYLEALKYLPQDEIRKMVPADQYILRHMEEGTPNSYDRVITYTPNGAGDINGWYIHLRLEPQHEENGSYHGTGDEVIDLFFGHSDLDTGFTVCEWFDYYSNPNDMDWSSSEEIVIDAYPDVTFSCTGGQIIASQTYNGTDMDEHPILISGMPIWNAYFTDLTGDGMPEICATVSYGSGIVDTHVVAFDYVNGQEYTLWERGEYDYSLAIEGGNLSCEKRNYDDQKVVDFGILMLVDSVGGEGKRLELVSEELKTENEGSFYYADNTGSGKYYLTIPREGVSSIEVSMPNSSGGCQHADGSPFEKGEQVYLDLLDGVADLRGVSVAALDADGKVLFTLSVPEGNGSQPVNVLVAGGWMIAPKDVSSSLDELQSVDIGTEATAGEQAVMVPTEAKLRGLCAGALFVPIEGNTYRYELAEAEPKNVTADELLDTFTENTELEGIVWEVYSLKEYPDKTAVLIISGTNSAWLCRYSPSGRADADALQKARDAGYVIMEDGLATYGQKAWLEFYETTQQGKAASITVGHFHTLDPERCVETYYEAFKEDYPHLFVLELSFDGETYTLSWDEFGTAYTRTYEYLMKYNTRSLQDPCVRYVLTHDDTVTWEQLFNGLISSQYGAYIDHYSIYTDKR